MEDDGSSSAAPFGWIDLCGVCVCFGLLLLDTSTYSLYLSCVCGISTELGSTLNEQGGKI
jgi:hypothetical protein